MNSLDERIANQSSSVREERYHDHVDVTNFSRDHFGAVQKWHAAQRSDSDRYT